MLRSLLEITQNNFLCDNELCNNKFNSTKHFEHFLNETKDQ